MPTCSISMRPRRIRPGSGGRAPELADFLLDRCNKFALGPNYLSAGRLSLRTSTQNGNSR